MTYASRLRAKLDPQHPCNKSFGQRVVIVSEEVVEREFQEKLRGGFNTKKSNRCDRCFMYKSDNGRCNCD